MKRVKDEDHKQKGSEDAFELQVEKSMHAFVRRFEGEAMECFCGVVVFLPCEQHPDILCFSTQRVEN
jgi:hypothetical protein